MKKLVTLGLAAAFAALSFTAATAPAQAGGISFGFGGYSDDWGYDHWDDDYYGGGVYVEIDPDDYDDDDYGGSDWDKHVSWCENHFQTYDEDTDMYFYKPGKQKHCDSPWS